MIASKATSIALVLGAFLANPGFSQRTEELRVLPPGALDPNDFGSATQIDGDWAVVGDPTGSPSFNTLLGVVLVYRRTQQGWKHWQTLRPSSLRNGGLFGGALALSGTQLIVGAAVAGPGWDGRAYAYSLENEIWVLTQTLKAHDGPQGVNFGTGLALDGDTLVVTDRSHSTPYPFIGGACYIYERGAQGWALSDFFLAPDPQTTPHSEWGLFGSSCDLEGDVLVVGAPSFGQGMAFVYRRTASGWARESDLSTPQFNPQIQMQLGNSVSIRGNTIAVGAPVGINPFFGGVPPSVFMFDYDPGLLQWQQGQTLRASDSNLANPRDLFGTSVSLSGDRLLVGAPWGGFNGRNEGTAYTFERDAGVWNEVERLVASDPNNHPPVNGAGLGSSVSLDNVNNRVLIGAPQAWTGQDQWYAGKAYFYDLNLGAVVCGGFTNSLAQETRLTVTGNRTVANANVALSVYDAPPGKFGIFVAGPGGTQTPFGSAGASLCVGQPLKRLSDVQTIGPDGSAMHQVDFSLPANAGLLYPGATLTFQFLHRDLHFLFGTQTLMASQAVEVVFE